MNYKKIIKSQKIRFKILDTFKFIPDESMIKAQYKIKMGRNLNLKNPTRFSEKLQWYKLNYRNDLMTTCADKHGVREFIKQKGLNDILVKSYGVFKNPNEINFKKLPEKFIIKTTNGSGTNFICKDKRTFNNEKVVEILNEWSGRNIFASGREWSYKNIVPQIIVEELLEDNSNEFDGINDYKIMCFNGKAEFIVLDVDRNIGHKRNIYTKKWEKIDVSTDYPNIDREVKIPSKLAEMITIAETLSKDFPFVRVDLYLVNEKIYFGEMTFYPWTGYIQFHPDAFDFKIGEKFKLPVKKIMNERKK
ncbi:ATP-grasp fold amidoligase family protein [Exiguobacterium indicum]|uniref:ATP-grasp fold amidoligase family protein n=1 Tax=Exiguobacterium indicum TaxID=296995 RepID=UPI00398209AB